MRAARLAMVGAGMCLATFACWPNNGALPHLGDGFAYTLNNDFVCSTDGDCQSQYGIFIECDLDRPDCTRAFAGTALSIGRCIDGTCRVSCAADTGLDAGYGYHNDGVVEMCPKLGEVCIQTIPDTSEGAALTFEESCFQVERDFHCVRIDHGYPVCLPEAEAEYLSLDVDVACQQDSDCQSQSGLFEFCGPEDSECLSAAGFDPAHPPELSGRCVNGTCRVTCFDPAALSAGRGFFDNVNLAYGVCPPAGSYCTSYDVEGGSGVPLEGPCGYSDRAFSCVTTGEGERVCVPPEEPGT